MTGENVKGQNGCVLWFTGLSGAGKTTISNALAKRLTELGVIVFELDGDVLRTGLSKDLGFSEEDRNENIRRVTEVSKLFADCGVICMSAFISPFAAAREHARRIVGADRFFEIYVSTGLDVCESRDTKGLYQKARAGEIDNFTGITSPYEKPDHPSLVIDTATTPVSSSVELLVDLLVSKGRIALQRIND